ncbi:MAG: stage III sporulation protein AC [Ruminococcaceae bacterium]|nr:stage III sporulation protein AC [Oscillospiraceae bacterium]
MDITMVLKIAGTGLLIAVAYQILTKSGRDEQAMLLSLTGVIFVLMILVSEIGDLFGEIRTIFGI